MKNLNMNRCQTILSDKMKKVYFPFFGLFLLLFLSSCDSDAPNHAIFRETLDPFHAELEVGMSQDDLESLIAEEGITEIHEFAYSAEHRYDFGYDEEKEIDGEIYQVTMGGNPANVDGVSSICFIKVLLVDDGDGGKHILDFGDVSCPA